MRYRLLVALLIAAPVVVFFVVLNWKVGLAPLIGMDAVCAKCNRKASRTLPSAAAALRVQGIYVYDRKRYNRLPPVWCANHGPDSAPENAVRAFGLSLVGFAIAVFVYKKFAPENG